MDEEEKKRRKAEYMRRWYEANKDKERERVKKWREANKEKKAEINKNWREANRDRSREIDKKWREDNRDKVNKINRNWREANKEKRAEYARKHREDASNRLVHNMRNRVWKALIGQAKKDRTMELVGCTPEFLMKHLEKRFKPGMTWENYGEWHVDHIKPCASFDLTKLEEQKKCFHYTNLQPLWGQENMSKGDRY